MAITHVQRMRVQWVDTDGSGLIHYTAALRYFEAAEHALVRQLFEGRASESFMLPRVHVEADYRGPLRYPDEFDCTAAIAAVGTTSVTYAYEIRRADGPLCASSEGSWRSQSTWTAARSRCRTTCAPGLRRRSDRGRGSRHPVAASCERPGAGRARPA